MGIKFKSIKKIPLKVNYGASQRTPPKLRWFLLVILLSLPLIYLIYSLIYPYIFVKFPGLIVFDTYTVRATENYYVENIPVRVGQTIKPNQLLVRFKSNELNTKLNYFEKERDALQAIIKRLETEKEIPFKALKQLAEEDIKISKQVYENFKKYTQLGHIAALQLEQARQNYLKARNSLITLEKEQIKVNKENIISFEVDFKRRLREAQFELNKLQQKKMSFEIVASKTGTVKEINSHEQEFVAMGQPVLTIVTDSNLHIMAYIEPKNVEDVYLGRKVWIVFPDNKEINGKIINVPGYTEQLVLKSELAAKLQNKLIVIIEPIEKPPEKYQVFGLPVQVKLD